MTINPLDPGGAAAPPLRDQPAHVVMLSSGVASFIAAAYVCDAYGQENVTLLFTDVKGDSGSPHDGEDEDNYRFLEDCAKALPRADLQWIHGEYKGSREGIWDVFRRRRRIGSGYAANCSFELKQRVARDWLREFCPDPARTSVYVGIDWSEEHRNEAIVRKYDPYDVGFPLQAHWARENDLELLDKHQMLVLCRTRFNIEPPRLYKLGYAHANCGGFCVKAGKGHFAHLLTVNRDRYLYHEDQEEQTRAYLDKDVSILNNKTKGGGVQPLTLRSFREQIEGQSSLFGVEELYDPNDIGGCGCFVDDDAELEAEAAREDAADRAIASDRPRGEVA